jgi:site-specific recombinase XerD
MNIQEALTQFIEDTENLRSKETARTYGNGIAIFRNYLTGQGISLASEPAVISAKLFIGYPGWISKYEYEPGRKFAPLTSKVYMAATKQFMEWALMQGCISFNYAEQLRIGRAFKELSKKHEALMVRFPAEDVVEKLRVAVRQIKAITPTEKLIRFRDIAIIEVLASSGCRNFEAVNLQVGSVDVEQRRAKVLGKGRKERYIYFTPAAIVALKDYWILRGAINHKDPAFARHDAGVNHIDTFQPITMTTVRNVVKEAQKLSGVNEFSPHWFRHAFAIKALKETGNLAMVQDFLGHADPKSTRVYAKIEDADRQATHREIFK